MSSKTQSGFTMIEAVIVVAIIILMAAIAIPSIAQFLQHYHIRGAVQEVRSEIQTARSRAVMNDVKFGVSFVILNDDEGVPRRYQWVIEDAIDDVDAEHPRGTRVPVSTILGLSHEAARPQRGEARELPGDVIFGKTCPGFSGASKGVRFTRLGMMCNPASTDPLCPEIDAGQNLIMVDEGEARICLVERRRGLTRELRITPGGHTEMVPVETP